ncbi:MULTISPECIES: GspE/PulE family protein [unclassified Herbaspirillum]|uniref:GspE/PulE family protein n=1 Tax=unclassified Herbaspirillum TaxID=2624150 RepID=UPI00114D7298|nr:MULTISPECIES: ATPase, T2SS/T4P/T4SS family [unclassified Herbaspirillum]MBB5390533.1 type II secretory ATPase GspE/PulE/Tfp pilus assembly ATPase PilB-like protein [Herbaspirillum sp. SJZ102]TQK08977.1 type II secretory ATPase GspE/PulE/Tfp pilus assembly ATPase PilB-like protein [Herbaspirillum sp. SJZ130]TQK14336.1 type II secretory ATPase GspE/PulE/Tfp pilus assembly ATPase PilB-like protein [Herbaspirillum sp. SJZ106]TWC66647.1 type II secretory ATPase GspE/PulE/Tfp pilus assembly ATPase
MNYTLPDLVTLVREGTPVLSLEQGVLEVAEDNRGLMCLIGVPRQPGHGILVVSSSHRLDPHVLSYQETIRRHGLSHEVVVSSMRNVLDLYRLGKGRYRAPVGTESEAQRYIIEMVREAVTLRASDIHIVARHDYCEIRCRIDGYLRPMGQLRSEEGPRLCATIYQSMCDVAEPTFKPMQAQRSRMKDEFLRECGLSGARINTRPLDRGMMMVLRLLYADTPGAAPTLADLGYLPEQCEALDELMEHRTGVVLLSGPTGSGKSTTLKVVMQKLMAENTGIHLLTLEDPPEYEIEGANQSPVGGERGSSAGVEQEWANAIADAMRLDPDVIMVGEVRDAVTAKMAFRAAMTGHLIWTTIHANDALAILPRLEDEGVMQSLLTDSTLVIGLVNQSLVQRLCSDCKIPLKGNEHLLGPRLLKRLQRYCDLDGICLQGDGCESCKQQGTAGRTVVAEVVRTSPGLMQAYVRGHHLEATRYWVRHSNGISKIDALIRKINDGLVDPRAGERIVGPIQPAGASLDSLEATS